MPVDEPIELPRAVMFDMDGTLTEPMLDFPTIKAQMGIGDRAILEAMADMSPARRAEAEAVLLRHEQAAAERSTLNPGCRELLAWLAGQGVPVALITRNSTRSLRTVIDRHGLPIAVTLSRSDAKPKPDPEALYAACDRLGVAAAGAWMVGDGRYDVEQLG